MAEQSLSEADARHDRLTAIDSRRRVYLLDALRGGALFGVLLVNMLWFAGYENSVTPEQFAQLPAAQWDRIAEEVIDQLVYAKAIGIFAFLFGVGFAMQMERWRRQGARSDRLYMRRLIGLLAVGLVHWFGLWSGEILHVYALAGMVLLLVRGWRPTALVLVGLPLAISARPLLTRLPVVLGAGEADSLLSTAEQYATRLGIFLNGTFSDIVSLQVREDCLPDIASGALLAAICHALARFMLGVAVARGRYLEKAHLYKRQFAWIAACTLPLGLVAQRDWVLTGWLATSGWAETPDVVQLLGHLCNSAGVVSMTVGYVAAFAVAWQWLPVRRILNLLVPVGQSALTNYLMQTAINMLLFFGFGLALMGRVGALACVLLSLIVFSVQVLASHWWMNRFRFGPAEWLWRWWTYQQRPSFRRA